MTWHPFKLGGLYSLDQIVETCEAYISSGQIINVEEKLRRVELIRNCGHTWLTYRPSAASGWGASPLNENLWKTSKGYPIVPRSGFQFAEIYRLEEE